MGIARDARADSSFAAETKTGLRQPEQAGPGAFEFVRRGFTPAAAPAGDVLPAGTTQRPRSVFGIAQSGVSSGGNRCTRQIGSGNAESAEDAKESQDQRTQGCVLLSRVGSSGSPGF